MSTTNQTASQIAFVTNAELLENVGEAYSILTRTGRSAHMHTDERAYLRLLLPRTIKVPRTISMKLIAAVSALRDRHYQAKLDAAE